MAIDFGPDDDLVTKSKGLKLTVMALGIFGIFCLLMWSMFADSKNARCVTKARFAARETIHVHDVRWTASGGCEYLASIVQQGLTNAEKRKAMINKADARWMPEVNVMRYGGTD